MLTITRSTHWNITAKRFFAVALLLLLAVSASAQTQDRSATDGKTPLALTPGAPAGSYALSGFDNINYYNGNLNFHLPLLAIGGRGEAQMTMMLAIDSKGWHVKHKEVAISPAECGAEAGFKCMEPTYGATNFAEADRPTPTAGFGPGVLFGRTTGAGSNTCNRQGGTSYGKTVTRLTFSAPDGTEYDLRDQLYAGQPQSVTGGPCNGGAVAVSRGTIFTSADGNAATFISDQPIKDKAYAGPSGTEYTYPSGYLMLKDGSRYRIDGGKVTWLRDRNGNTLSFTYSTNLMEITDSLNRKVTVEYNVTDVAPYGLCARITYKGFGGADRIIRVSSKSLSHVLRPGFTAQTYGLLFPELYPSPNTLNSNGLYNPERVSAVWMPDGRSYQFLYNSYGELARVDLPTGGRVEYDYTEESGCIDDLGSNCTDLNSSVLEIYRRVTTKRVYKEEGTLENKTTISKPLTTRQCATCLTLPESVVTVDQLDSGNHRLMREKHYYYGDPVESLYGSPIGYQAWNEGKEFKTEQMDGDGVTPLRRVEQTWEQGAPLPTWIANYLHPEWMPGYNVRVAETRTTLVDTNQVSKQTFDYDQYNNQKDVYEYDFGSGAPGAFRRRTHTDYLTSNTISGAAFDYDSLSPDVTNDSTTSPEEPAGPGACWECDPDPVGGSPVAVPGGPYTGTAGANVVFNGNGSTDDVGVISYRWNFGDGTSANGATAAHAYSQAGTYTVLLTVWDEDGQSDGGTTTVTINSSTTPAPPTPDPAVQATIHIRNLPSQQWVSADAAGNQKKVITSYEYDNYTTDTGNKHAPLTQRVGISGLDTSFTHTRKTRGNVTSVSRRLIQDNDREVTTYRQYDVAGNVVKSLDANLNPTSFTYKDNFGAPHNNEARTHAQPAYWLGEEHTYAYPTEVKNARNQIVYTQYDYYIGKAVNVEDTNGTVYSGYYDESLDRPTQMVSAYADTTLRRQMKFTYDDADRTIRTTSDLAAYNDNKLKSEVVYDGLGRTVETRSFETTTTYVKVLTEYGAFGRVSRQSNPLRSGDPLWTKTTYDELGRVTVVETPAETPTGTGAKVNTSYLGNTVTVRDQVGKDRKSTTDALGRLIEVIEDPGTGGGLNYQTLYTYDVLDNLTKVEQGEQERTFAYDSLKRLTSATNPESGTVAYKYDDDGNLIEMKDARQVVTTYTYDSLNRVKTKIYSDGTPSITSTYDGDDLPGGAPTAAEFNRGASIGRLVAVTYGSGGTGNYYGYDALGQVTQSLQKTITQKYSFPEYKYDRAGNLTSEKYPSGRVVKTSYDLAGRISTLSGTKDGKTNTYASGFGYTAHGAVSKVMLGNGLWEHTLFNSRLQPTEIGLGWSAADPNLMKLSYDYGTVTQNNGNLVSQTIKVEGATSSQVLLNLKQTYTYDELNRLETAREVNQLSGNTQTFKQAFTYKNGQGNGGEYGNRRLDWTATTGNVRPVDENLNPSISSANNRITTAGYSYDLAGNLKTVPGHAYAYDAENRMVTFDDNQEWETNYTYDGEGRRVQKVRNTSTGPVTTTFVYDAGGKLATEYETYSAAIETGTRYLTQDHLGSTRIVTDGLKVVKTRAAAASAVKARYDYLPFGEQINSNIGGRSVIPGYTTSDTTRQKFTGYQRDNESDLDYARARYYANVHGRFISPDPLLSSGKRAQPQSWNRYSYTINNPLKYTDPTGLVWGQYQGNNGQWYYQWFDTDQALKASGATPVTQFIVQNLAGKWLRFDPNSNHYGVYNSWAGAMERTNGPLGDQSTAQQQAFNFALADTGGRIGLNILSSFSRRFFGSLFARGASEVAEEGVLRFSQTTASPLFSAEGKFAGNTIGQVAGDLRSGVLRASDVPVGTVNGADGVRLIVNTRSSLALTRAGIEQRSWSIIDLSVNQTVRTQIQQRLFRNGLTNQGTNVLRITGMGTKAASNLQ